MVDRIGGAQDYNRYTSVEQKRAKEADEKFTLDQPGVKTSDSEQHDNTLIQKKKTEENAAGEFGGLKHGAQSSVRKKSGVILELSDQTEDNAEEQAEKTQSGNPLPDWRKLLGSAIQKAKELLGKTWDIIWNSPEDKTKTVPDDVPDSELETADVQETAPAAGIPENTAGSAKQTVEQSTQSDLQAFLTGTQKGDLAKNTELLSYYDKKGRMVQISDKDRILHNK